MYYKKQLNDYQIMKKDYSTVGKMDSNLCTEGSMYMSSNDHDVKSHLTRGILYADNAFKVDLFIQLII